MARRLSTIVITVALLRAADASAWITTLHGGPSDPSEARSVAVDSNGDVLAAGARPNVVKLDGATGGPIWTQSFDEAYAFGVATSATGLALVAGGVQGMFGGWQQFYAILDGATGDAEPYVKLSPLSNYWLEGALFAPPQKPVVYGNRGAAYVALNNTWQRELAPHALNGYASGRLHDAAADAAGNVVVVGRSDGLIIDQFGRLVFDRPHLLATKLAVADGATIWQYVVDEASEGAGLSLDANGDVLIAGAIAGAGSTTIPGDMLVVKLSGADGSELWRRSLDGTAGGANDIALAVRADAGGDAIVAGRLTLTPSDPLFRNGLAEFTVLKLAGADGAELWRYTAPNTTLAPDIIPGLWGGTKGEGRAIAFDADGDPVVAGVTNASWFESGGTGHVADFTMVKLSDADGSQRWLYVPGAGQARAIAAAPDGIVAAGHLNREASDTIVYDMAVVKVSEGIVGTEVDLSDGPDPASRSLKVKSKSRVTSPYVDRYGDPTYDGGRIVLSDPTSGATQTIDLPASGWRAKGRGFLFSSPSGPCQSVRIDARQGVKAKCQGAEVHLPTGRSTRGALGVQLELGPAAAAHYCMGFGGRVERDDGVRFKAKNAAAPQRCAGT